ncbi:hypothetical protein EUZ85_09965 [Hahella sp. KA22]|uniref:hypothetical protein n=1 Tax=Hahella sp. KA22 TaxID=1628392 RepID=UPI000FDD0E27|nr:hypothetical protein [Hahella sp. KA22]AZZ91029.1 hypothetical protein ENC22_07410 [Hahella sp. KA22]QAY54399.1 hypothetical protein EUZ85_09965 [Hahella sp. KA22]
MSQASSNFTRVGVPGAGKPVYAVGRAARAYVDIQELCKKGNYWATMVQNELVRLTSGKLGHNHVYVKRQTFPGGVETFFLKLPGCEATVKELPGGYYIAHLEVNDDYFALQEKGAKPGMHYAYKKPDSTWAFKFLNKAQLAIKDRIFNLQAGLPNSHSMDAADNALVSIGAPEEEILTAVDLGLAHIKNSPFNDNKVGDYGFNLMYTPGTGDKGKVGGCISLREALNPEYVERLMETSYILADAMQQAEKAGVKVAWVSHEAGSAYLTQAMSIVRSRGLMLSKQTIYLSRPLTNPDKAYNLSQELGMTLNAKLSHNNFNNLNELAAGAGNLWGVTTSIKRLRKDDSYKAFDYCKEVWGSIGSAGNVWKIGVAVTSGVAAYYGGLSAVVTAVGAGAGVTVPFLVDNMRSMAQWPSNQAAIEGMVKPKLEAWIAGFRK